MQPTESYEAANNSTSSYLFISCPNWGQDDSNYGTYNICPHYSGTNDNGTLQSYQESHGGAGYSSLLVFNDTFTYDNLNRLTTATDTNQASSLQWARTYNYDQWGNMWQPNPYNQPVSGNTPTTNVYNASTNHDTRWTYDNAGNLTNVNGNGAAYNAENQITWLSATTGNGGGVETLAYDAVGQRVQKTISGTGGSTTVYVYDAFGQLASEYVNGTSTRDYVFDGVGDLMAVENASGPCYTCYLAYDHLGSVRLVMDQNANVVGRHDYLPFGQEVSGYAGRTTPGFNVAGSVPNDATQKFTGQIRDQESGMDFFNARYLTWSLARFNSPDPGNAGTDFVSSQSWNGYAYVLGNPLAFTDPTGKDCGGGANWDGDTPCFYGGTTEFYLPYGAPVMPFGSDTISAPTITSPIDTSSLPLETYNGGIISNSGGGGGGGGGTKTVPQKLACAAAFGKDHSIASMLGFGNSYVANLFGGNSVGGLVNLGLSLAPGGGSAPDFPKMVAGGASLDVPVNDILRLSGGQGIQGPTSVTGTIRTAALGTLFNAATSPATLTSIAEGGEIALQGGITAAEYASGAAIAKFALDVGTVGYGYFFACGN
jgi:RHS repeat-associated protein